jgi:iron complex outermembrane receptor protein
MELTQAREACPIGRTNRIGWCFCVFLVLGLPAKAGAQTDLSEASLEQLMNIEVTTVSKKEQKLSRVAAAIFVITQEDIRHSGARNIPDLLRLVPGMDVAQEDANTWAISARGFNDIYANKLLVMIDGRSVYDPAFGGVFWDLQDVPLEDIDRIEVIRGPGGTIWGANAMNGVINIITKRAKATQGGLLQAGSGSRTTAQDLVQYGGPLRRHGFFRVFGQYANENSSTFPSGERAADGWHISHGGFRSDWDLTPKDDLTLEGDFFNSAGGETLTSVFLSLAPPFQATFNDRVFGRGGNILAHWDHRFSDRSDTSVQMYYDGGRRQEYGIHEDRDTFDFDFKNHVAIGSRQDLVWGFGYRVNSFYVRPGYAIAMIPMGSTNSLGNSFVQDEIRLSDSVWLSLGSKFEHNTYTGFEYEPGARLLWSPSDRQAAWAAVSRAIRQPTLEDVDVQVNEAAFPGPDGLVALVSVFGNPHIKSEELLAYEAGYRAQASRRISMDVSAFYNIYDRLRTYEPAQPFLESSPSPPHLVLPEVTENKMHGSTYGAEVSSTLRVSSWWKVSPGYAWLKMNLHPDPGSLDTDSPGVVGCSPRHQFQIRSSMDLPRHWMFDSGLYYVGRLSALSVSNHARVDARLSWRPARSWELSVVGQNLVEPRHLEFNDYNALYQATQIQRSVFGEIRWWFGERSP